MKDQFFTITEIGRRGSKLAKDHGFKLNPIDLIMSIEKATEHDPSIDLDTLLGFQDGDFGHDVFGIHRHLNRETGELMDCFSPRCTR